MKKVILKSTLAVVAVAASCLGAWKAYGAYGSVDNSMLMENIEALSDNGEPNDGDNGGQTVIHYTESERTITIHEYNELGQIVRTKSYKEKCCLITKFGTLECDYVLCDS
ncbi:MAG: hypothetical protein IJ467_06020, partial [Bacteroidaceae bacterium]|nr:hypothetical protein [Bacteroidaceae bacterium]